MNTEKDKIADPLEKPTELLVKKDFIPCGNFHSNSGDMRGAKGPSKSARGLHHRLQLWGR